LDLDLDLEDFELAVVTVRVERLRLAAVLLLCRDFAIFFWVEEDSDILEDFFEL